MPPLYRVAAVVVGIAITVGAVSLVGIHLLVSVPAATAVWIGLGVAQEHDGRVHLPVDQDFLDQLRAEVEPLLVTHGLEYHSAQGPCRARRNRTDSFLFERSHEQHGCVDFWIHRANGPGHGIFEILYGYNTLAECLLDVGHTELSRRIRISGDPADDVTMLLEALHAAPSSFWEAC